MAKPVAVVFDLDDTLYPEWAFVRSGFTAVDHWLTAQHQVRGFFERAWRLHLDGVRGRIFNRALELLQIPVTATLISEMLAVYREHTPAIEPYPDTLASLDALGAHFQLALLTDGYAAVQRRKVNALGLADRFAAVVYSVDLGREYWKPSPAPFLAVARMLGDATTPRVYVGDNPAKDFLGARSVGWRSIRIRRPDGEHATREAQPGCEPDVEVPSLASLTSDRLGAWLQAAVGTGFPSTS